MVTDGDRHASLPLSTIQPYRLFGRHRRTDQEVAAHRHHPDVRRGVSSGDANTGPGVVRPARRPAAKVALQSDVRSRLSGSRAVSADYNARDLKGRTCSIQTGVENACLQTRVF